MALVFNILKIAGVFVAGVAGIIGILGETKTEDKKHLTRSGKWLCGMAIVGLGLAVGSQIWEWVKSLEDDRVARSRNEELLVRLDKEAKLAAQLEACLKKTPNRSAEFLNRFQPVPAKPLVSAAFIL